MTSAEIRLPQPAPPGAVLAVGAYLKNTAVLLQGDRVCLSPLHGDLSTPQAQTALVASLERLVAAAGAGGIVAVAHDLHPDFPSTHLALDWAHRLGVPAIGVQHHHAHLAAVQAEAGADDGATSLGLALDGVGLGDDGRAWGGELLRLHGARRSERVAHLPWLALPGGDVAAREPWRLLAGLLHDAGQGDRIEPLLAPRVGAAAVRGVRQVLARGLNCPPSSAAGRWFDVAAGALGLSLRQTHEAEAAQALERAAADWCAAHGAADIPIDPAEDGDAEPEAWPSLDTLSAFVVTLLDETDAGRGAARFQRRLALALARATVEAARRGGEHTVWLGGGCFFNRLLRTDIARALARAGLRACLPCRLSCGDAGLALGQAWVAGHRIAARRAGADPDPQPEAAPWP